jgi:hypothetical protein
MNYELNVITFRELNQEITFVLIRVGYLSRCLIYLREVAMYHRSLQAKLSLLAQRTLSLTPGVGVDKVLFECRKASIGLL